MVEILGGVYVGHKLSSPFKNYPQGWKCPCGDDCFPSIWSSRHLIYICWKPGCMDNPLGSLDYDMWPCQLWLKWIRSRLYTWLSGPSESLLGASICTKRQLNSVSLEWLHFNWECVRLAIFCHKNREAEKANQRHACMYLCTYTRVHTRTHTPQPFFGPLFWFLFTFPPWALTSLLPLVLWDTL